MTIDRRTFVAAGAAALGATAISPGRAAPRRSDVSDAPTWIWYPGQLAAYRHARRIRLAVERCTHVGYPANFRQPLTQVWFRRTGIADKDQALRWKGPAGRIRVRAGGRQGDITDREALLPAGKRDVVVQIDFADTMPCLLLDGGAFSTGPQWLGSVDKLPNVSIPRLLGRR